MEIKNSGFFKANIIVLSVAVLVYAYYLFTAFSGGRICDCETTEKYAGQTTRGSYVRTGGVHGFYHK
ncbi:hypothetical protein ACLI1A_01875 [Flavobacterium sp. RHBU_3]|uniref:hypothetical protein n=1 Tax=Flavobacterium sp. RHBU_3 TaxID=3391184 RepID=UPI003985146C